MRIARVLGVAGCAGVLLLLAGRAAVAEDPVDELIQSEKRSYAEWLDSSEDPPAALANAELSAMEIWSPSYEEPALLCTDVDVEALVDMSGEDKTQPEFALNLDLPRVREAFGDSCLLRPGDRVVAITAEGREERRVGKILVRRERPACPDSQPYTLWASFDSPLTSEPLFVGTDPQLSTGPASIIPAGRENQATLGPEIRAQLSEVVALVEDFAIQGWDIPGTDEMVLALTRKNPGTEDDELPAMIMVIGRPGSWTPMWTERVDARKGTGRFEIKGFVDFDGDNIPEIVVDGVHQSCLYRAVFSEPTGRWERLPLPVKACRC